MTGRKTFQVATLAGGCFWCTEAIFQRLKGVKKVVSGYSGGNREKPRYEQVSTGATGHAEAIQITFDSHIISFETLLEIFFATHDPTTPNQQGADIGTQYRSVIFYHSKEQQVTAERIKLRLEDEGTYNHIVTEIIPFTAFYEAEEYHQNFYNNQPSYGYCRIVVDPKIKKLVQQFSQEVKEEYR